MYLARAERKTTAGVCWQGTWTTVEVEADYNNISPNTEVVIISRFAESGTILTGTDSVTVEGELAPKELQ